MAGGRLEIISSRCNALQMPDDAVTTDGRENIKVLVRIRPLLEKETGPVATVVGTEGTEILVTAVPTPNKLLRCRYDAVIGPDVSQEGVSSHVHECTSAVLEGENSTIFAYGQTGSGKTYTMFGPEISASEAVQLGLGKGVIPLAVTDLFEGLAFRRRSNDDESTVWVSLVQLYKEQLYDMLRDPHRVHPLAIHQQSGAGVYVQGLSEYAVHNAEECLHLLRIGREHRAIRETHMNQASSRSHSIFQIVVEQKRRCRHDGERTLRSKFNLVDLAGSEKWDVKQDMEESRVNEMMNINVSLHTLGRVIAALSAPAFGRQRERGRQPHIPYRDSKLTRLLQDSLGGNTRTRIIATLSPARECVDETISTLRFADRAKQVMTFVRVNECRPVDHALVQRLQGEVKHLRELLYDTNRQQELAKGESTDHVPRPAALLAVAEAQLLGHQETIKQLRRENAALREKPVVATGTEGAQRVGEDISTISTLQDVNRVLENTIHDVIHNVKRFFHFEIEEEELRTDLSKVVANLNSTIPGGGRWQQNGHGALSPPRDIAAVGFQTRGVDEKHESPVRLTTVTSRTDRMTPRAYAPGENLQGTTRNTVDPKPLRKLPRGDSVSLSPLLGLSAYDEPRAEKMTYRLRGKRANEVVIVKKKEVTEEDQERRLRKELKLAKDRMKKNLQLQEWLLQKEQREMEVLAFESAKRSEMERDRRRKDEEFRRRAAKQKAKLKRYYQTAEMEARNETDRRSYELLHVHLTTALPTRHPKETEDDIE